jgi:hypothetical protein
VLHFVIAFSTASPSASSIPARNRPKHLYQCVRSAFAENVDANRVKRSTGHPEIMDGIVARPTPRSNLPASIAFETLVLKSHDGVSVEYTTAVLSNFPTD